MHAMQIVLHLNINQVLLVSSKWKKKEKAKIAVPSKYLNNFWRSLEMPLINCKVDNPFVNPLTWIENCVLI